MDYKRVYGSELEVFRTSYFISRVSLLLPFISTWTTRTSRRDQNFKFQKIEDFLDYEEKFSKSDFSKGTLGKPKRPLKVSAQ